MKILFGLIALLSLAVLFCSNVVYSLVALVSTFFFSALLLISLHLEFLGYVLIVVYVGAIAILFLFVVMTLDITEEEKTSSFVRNVGGYSSHFVALLFSVVVFWEIRLVLGPLSFWLNKMDYLVDAWSLIHFSNGLNAVSASLYTYYFAHLFLAGFLLLLAMVGATVLTLEDKLPTQCSTRQSFRRPSTAVFRSGLDSNK